MPTVFFRKAARHDRVLRAGVAPIRRPYVEQGAITSPSSRLLAAGRRGTNRFDLSQSGLLGKG